VPFLLVGLPAGVWVDRLARRPVLVVADVGRAIALSSIPVTAGLHLVRMPQLYAVSFLTGVLTVFFDVAYQSYLPSLVEREQLVDGNGKLEFTRAGAEIVGPIAEEVDAHAALLEAGVTPSPPGASAP
jgi:MFS family permease